jgi:hypothetical protein
MEYINVDIIVAKLASGIYQGTHIIHSYLPLTYL